MEVIAGCDGGGTKTVVRVQAIDASGTVLDEGRGMAGPANVSFDIDAAVHNVRAATLSALELAGLESHAIDVMVAALAGAGRGADQDRARSLIRQTCPVARIEVVPDAAVLFAAAGRSGPAIALIVGTGSIAWARDQDGAIYRFGGWGQLLGDEGSGYWLGLEAIKRTVSHLNERDQRLRFTERECHEAVRQTDPLAREVLNHFSVGSLDDLIFTVRGLGDDRVPIAGLAPKVFAFVDTSEMADEIIESASNHLAGLILASARAAFGEEPSREVNWICAGGVGVNQELLRRRIRERCFRCLLHLREPILVSNPVDGALKLACDLL